MMDVMVPCCPCGGPYRVLSVNPDETVAAYQCQVCARIVHTEPTIVRDYRRHIEDW